MRLIHNHLAKLADVCASAEHSRFGATTGVELVCREDRYFAAATDGRRLIVVEGEYPQKADEYPAPEAIKHAPNGQTKSVIDGKAWKKAMSAAAKLTASKRGKSVKPVCQSVAVVQGEQLTTLAATDGHESQAVETVRNVEGRFPNWRQVTPDDAKAEYEISVDPWLLAETLLAVASIGCDDESKRVVLRLFGSHCPMTIKSTSPNQPATTGVVVPLLPGNQAVQPVRKDSERAKLEQRLDRMVAALRKVQAERDALKSR